tara:strand:- start:149 stop:334 length:186 start_codon:yes stop_codon:yes gene_type:complete
MSNGIEIKELRVRSRRIILDTCNTIGCKDCDLKWDGGCASSELENKIADLEYPEFASKGVK